MRGIRTSYLAAVAVVWCLNGWALLQHLSIVPGMDGFIAATWRVERKGKVSLLEVRPLERLDRATLRAVEEEGHALAAFLDPKARVEVRIAGVAPRARAAGARAGSPR